ncbi:MAG TPA: glycosyltransferase family 39 protein, partial [Herpetosiphonaceae bacterium]|nr:glycosyltransferase family 39 protein [Herpetosiphonaceae bacterium]
RALASRALERGLVLTTAGALLLAIGPGLLRLAGALLAEARKFDPSAIITLSLLGTLLLMLALRWPDINRALDRFDRRVRTRPRLGWLALAVITGIWLAYGWSVIRGMGYVGNADYSDNAVVARNLAAGRGWVVDYVTQFYRLYPGGSVTRVQETWPLAQPVWIAPFFAIFGVSDWAAKIPNLIFFALLAVVIYGIAVRLWDRRVGLAAVLLLLINKHMFRLLIYSTADLGFVVFYAAALTLLWRAVAGPRTERDRPLLLGSGLLIGLMCWQKTSAVVVAAGMGAWVLWRIWRSPRRNWAADLRRVALWWVLPAALVFAPFVARNLIEFGKPVYSTESYDAWVLEYRGTSSEDFEGIYQIFTNEGGLPGTGGLPDPSWIKRWGYQRTLGKISNQLRSVRDSLLPPSAALGPLSGKGNLMGNLDLGVATNPRAWLTAGSMLALIGLLTLRRRQASLMNLVLWSFAPYTLFLATYWHANEERYFVPLIPFLALLASAAIWAIHDGLARAAGGRWRPLALLAAGTLLVLALRPGWVEAADKSSPAGVQVEWDADMAAFAWLKANTPPDAVVMTRVPWQLNFHAERPAVMVPNHPDLETTLRIARYYRARYLLVNAITNNKEGAAEALGGLLRGEEVANFKQVAFFAAPKNRTIYIYEFPANYNDVAPLSLSGAGNGQQ